MASSSLRSLNEGAHLRTGSKEFNLSCKVATEVTARVERFRLLHGCVFSCISTSMLFGDMDLSFVSVLFDDCGR